MSFWKPKSKPRRPLRELPVILRGSIDRAPPNWQNLGAGSITLPSLSETDWPAADTPTPIGTSEAVWQPQPGPQAAAYASNADVIGYGGAAGGGKTDLLLGFAGTAHRRSVIYRRVFPSVRAIIERSREIFARGEGRHAQDSYNEQLHIWRLTDGRTIEFGAVQYEKDAKKQQGQPRDFIGIDEATEFPEATVRYLSGWNRTTVPGQRCRMVLTFNPPLDDSGTWVTRYFGPWLDDTHPDSAEDGEIRYVAHIDGQDVFYRTPDDAPEDIREWLKTRTFFHANLNDNPILAATGYGATIESLPEPLRSLLKGNFHAARMANPWQVIPTAWIKAAQARWKAQDAPGVPSAVGLDVARGGTDRTVVCRLHASWVAPFQKLPGAATPDGPSVAGLVLSEATAGVPIRVDVIGVGGSVYDVLKSSGARVAGINFAESAGDLRDKSGRLRFRNVRAAAYWMLREGLDPDHGAGIALPPDPELLADLAAARYSVTTSGVQIESKDDIKARLGRSPDAGDALALAWYTVQNPLQAAMDYYAQRAAALHS